MFSIVVCVIVGILVFICGYFAGWNNCHSKFKVGTPSTSTNSESALCVHHWKRTAPKDKFVTCCKCMLTIDG